MTHLAREALGDEPLHVMCNSTPALLGRQVGLNAGDEVRRPLLGLQPTLGIQHPHHGGGFVGQQAIRQ